MTATVRIVLARFNHVFSYCQFYTLSALLQAKFSLCEALARAALGETKGGMDCLVSAAYHYHRSAVCTSMTRRSLEENLQNSINSELLKLNSPYQRNWKLTISKARNDYLAGKESRSFWEWLDLLGD